MVGAHRRDHERGAVGRRRIFQSLSLGDFDRLLSVALLLLVLRLESPRHPFGEPVPRVARPQSVRRREGADLDFVFAPERRIRRRPGADDRDRVRGPVARPQAPGTEARQPQDRLAHDGAAGGVGVGDLARVAAVGCRGRCVVGGVSHDPILGRRDGVANRRHWFGGVEPLDHNDKGPPNGLRHLALRRPDGARDQHVRAGAGHLARRRSGGAARGPSRRRPQTVRASFSASPQIPLSASRCPLGWNTRRSIRAARVPPTPAPLRRSWGRWCGPPRLTPETSPPRPPTPPPAVRRSAWLPTRCRPRPLELSPQPVRANFAPPNFATQCT